MICTFIGHRDTPTEIQPMLKQVILTLIKNQKVHMFYVGNQGRFDSMVKDILQELSSIYSIRYLVVLAYMPPQNKHSDYSDTMYLDELYTVPYKYRIVERNKWMIKKSDFVVTYVDHIGQAREFKTFAEKHHKTVINLQANSCL